MCNHGDIGGVLLGLSFQAIEAIQLPQDRIELLIRRDRGTTARSRVMEIVQGGPRRNLCMDEVSTPGLHVDPLKDRPGIKSRICSRNAGRVVVQIL